MILDCFNRCPAFHSVLAHVAPESTLLYSAEWNIGTEYRPSIRRYLTKLDCFDDTMSAIDVVGE